MEGASAAAARDSAHVGSVVEEVPVRAKARGSEVGEMAQARAAVAVVIAAKAGVAKVADWAAAARGAKEEAVTVPQSRSRRCGRGE